MRPGVTMAEVAALIGDPGRANMLAALMDGRALTATELAFAAGISAPTASGHLKKLTEGGLLDQSRQGRHRYFALASGEVAQMLEAILVVAGSDAGTARPRATPRVPPELAECRTCYDHLAGRVAVAIADGLVARGAIDIDSDAAVVTPKGLALFEAWHLPGSAHAGGRRLLCRPCLDWSERRPHLAGRLGAAILDLSLERGFVRRRPESRAVSVTPEGRQGFADLFGIGFGG